ncbi:MAG: CHASE domain-containing protein [Thiotrichales bacterium]|nr:CHASE domain-containing protein [Thiotrichales bacterium]
MKHSLNFLVLIIGITLSVILTWTTHKHIQESSQLLFETADKEIILKIQSRMEAYRQSLYAGTSFFKASNEVTKDEWRLFVQTLRIDKNFAGIQGLGYAKVIPKEQAVNKNTSQEIHTSIVYLEPLDERNIRAVGYDMFSQETRREAMSRAMDSGEAAASGKVRLLQENGKDEQAGFLIYVPVYEKNALLRSREERVKALQGFVYAAFRVDDLMQGILGSRFENVRLDIYDSAPTASNLLYSSSAAQDTLDDFKTETRINVDGRTWVVVNQPNEAFFNDTKFEFNLPIIVLATGLLFSFLLFGMVRFTSTRQELAQNLANKMTQQYSEQTQRLNNILSGTNVGTWEWKVQTGETIFNELWVNMVGYTLKEVSPTTSDTWINLIHPDDVLKTNQALERHFKGETEFYEVELRLKHKDGHWVWILAKGKVSEWDADGQPLLMSGTQQDISNRKEVEQALRSERDLFSAGPVITIEWDLLAHWPVTYVSKNVYDILGYSADEMTSDGFTYAELVHPADLPTINEEVENYISAGTTSWEQSYRLRLKSGEYRWFYDFSRLIRDENNNVVSIRGYMFDQTHIKTLENQIIKEKNFISAIVENANAIIAVIDSTGTMIRLNPYGQAFSQYSLEEVSSEPYFWKRLLPENVQDKVTTIIENAKKGQLVSSFQNAWTAKDGTQRMFEWSNTLVKKSDGSMDYIATIGVDITETKKMEANLVQAKEEAIAANISKSQFLANMSHEIRTPMNAIIGLSQLMLDANLSPKERDTIQKIHGSSKMLLGIINDILDYSKIEADKLLLDKEALHLEDVLAQLRILFTQNAIEQGVELNFHLLDTVPHVILADELRLDQVLSNLLSNALKFTANGLVTLEISLVESQGNQATIQFSVSDTGIGLTQEECEKLFKPFTQADSSITRKYGGTGLGLAITQKLIQAMGGELKVKSEKGVGSTFYFEISAEVVSWPHHYPKISDKPYKVLLVDDQAICRQILMEMANHFGCLSDQVSSGKVALEMIKHADQADEGYDAIVIDYIMPEMDGKELALQIKAYQEQGGFKSKVPSLLLVSAHAIDEICPDTFGVEVCLNKPVTNSTFFDALSSLNNGIYKVQRQALNHKTTKEGAPNFAGLKVLLVEDNELNQEVASRMLHRAGVELIEVASDGKQAVEMFAKKGQLYDVILMDLQMPIMSGYDAAIQIRKQNQTVPIIALTAAAMIEDKERALTVGMNDHLGKPIDMQQLFATLEKWCGSGRTKDTLSKQKTDVNDVSTNAVLDIEFIKQNIGDDRDMLLHLLTLFSNQLENDFADIPEQIRNTPVEAHTVVHSIKGVSGNMGAHQLFELSSDLNKALKQGKVISEQDLNKFEEALKALKLELASQISLFTEQTTPVNLLNEVEFKALLKKVKVALNEGDLIETTSIQLILEALKQTVDESALTEWKEAIDAFEYDKAKEIMATWKI